MKKKKISFFYLLIGKWKKTIRKMLNEKNYIWWGYISNNTQKEIFFWTQIYNFYFLFNLGPSLLLLLLLLLSFQLFVNASFSVRLTKIIFANLFYYSTYFCYYLWVLLHFLVLFMSLTILFQLTFTFIYSTFSKKNLSFN